MIYLRLIHFSIKTSAIITQIFPCMLKVCPAYLSCLALLVAASFCVELMSLHWNCRQYHNNVLYNNINNIQRLDDKEKLKIIIKKHYHHALIIENFGGIFFYQELSLVLGYFESGIPDIGILTFLRKSSGKSTLILFSDVRVRYRYRYRQRLTVFDVIGFRQNPLRNRYWHRYN